MTSVASGGAAERMAARSSFKVVRAGSGTRERYSSTVFGAARFGALLAFAAVLRLPGFDFFALAFFTRPFYRRRRTQVHKWQLACALVARIAITCSLAPSLRQPHGTTPQMVMDGHCGRSFGPVLVSSMSSTPPPLSPN